jgi:hypothetical protein
MSARARKKRRECPLSPDISGNEIFQSTFVPFLRGICTENGILCLNDYLSKNALVLSDNDN